MLRKKKKKKKKKRKSVLIERKYVAIFCRNRAEKQGSWELQNLNFFLFFFVPAVATSNVNHVNYTTQIFCGQI